MAINVQDKEIQQYRDLLQPPERFEGGFGLKMLVAAVFLGFIMVPGSIYLSLFMGGSMTSAAQWVTVILFAEVAKRSMKNLRSQEIFLLFYMTGIALGGQVHGGVISQLLWNQYLVKAPAMMSMGVAQEVPTWVAPSKEILDATARTFFSAHWATPIAVIVGIMVIQRIDHFGLGYAMYRLTAHVEKLPFPMAPVGALGISAMAEADQPGQRWKWRCFSLGGVLGIAFGAIYIGVPAVTGALFGHPVKIIPIPWLDFTKTVSTESFMPATPINLVFDLGLVILGMVLPFWAVVGGFIGLLVTWTLNPTLYHHGMLTTWKPNSSVVDTLYGNHIDFYLSLTIGLAASIFLYSLWSALRPLMTRKVRDPQAQEEKQEVRSSWQSFFWMLTHRDRGRGDLSILAALAIYVASVALYITACSYLVPGFPKFFFLGYAFLWQPAITYVNAKLEGLVGQTVQIPMIREAAYIFSGYHGAAIWFAPIPINDYGSATRNFRVMELTGTRLTDIIRVELVAIPILLACSLLFCELIWRLAPIPGEAYPYTLEVWDLQARYFALQVTATSEGSSPFLEAINGKIIAWGAAGGLTAFIVLGFLNLPTFLIFGVVRGLGQTTPGAIIPEMIGALIGRFYLQKRFGHQNYKRYMMVLFAGYSAGVGLIAMGSVAFAWIVKSTTPLGY